MNEQIKNESESNLVLHAKREMQLVGLNAPDADYNGELYSAVIELMKVFSTQGHSGNSAAMTIDLFTTLASYKTLSPINSNPDEWLDVSEMSVEAMWQSKRCPSVFSKDAGKTWYSLDDVRDSTQNPGLENEFVR